MYVYYILHMYVYYIYTCNMYNVAVILIKYYKIYGFFCERCI